MRLILLLLTTLFSGTVIYLLPGSLTPVGRLIYGGATVGLLLICLINTRKFQFNRMLFTIFYLYVICSLIAGLKNSDMTLVIGALFLLCVYLSLVIGLPSVYGNESSKYVGIAIIISHIPFLYFPLMQGFSLHIYWGVFKTGNGFGSVAVTLLATMMAFYMKHLLDRLKSEKPMRIGFFKFWTAVGSAGFTCLLAILSGSRSSGICGLFILFLSAIILMNEVIRSKRKVVFKRFVKLMIVGAILIPVINQVLPIYQMFNQIVIEKFQRKHSDVLDGRSEVWRQTISEATMFGNGRDYFASETDLAAHNSFISILGQYGVVTLFFFIMFIAVTLIYSIRYAFSDANDQYKFLPLFMMVSFLMLSATDSMMLKDCMFGVFAAAGVTSIYKYKEAEKTKVFLSGQRIYRTAGR